MLTTRPHPIARLCLAALVGLSLAATSHAAARSPQVPVTGTALATFFATQGQTIDVNTQQLDLQRAGIPANTSFQMRPFVSGSATSGIYNAAAVAPALYAMLPGAASPGWFAIASFRTVPQRLIVNLFDQASSIQGTSTHLGADNADFGFYVQDAAGLFYSQDARNAGSAARMLAFNGTGAFVGSTWICTETGAGPGGDYADVITLVQFQFAPVSTQPSTWSRVKRLYQ